MDEKRLKPLSDTAAAGTPAAGQDARLTEREEFICLLKRHPELYHDLRLILAPQERPHEEQEEPHHNN